MNMEVKRKRNQRILRLFLNGKSMSDIHRGVTSISVTCIHKIIKQEAYHLTHNKLMKDLSPLQIRDGHKEILIQLLKAEVRRIDF